MQLFASPIPLLASPFFFALFYSFGMFIYIPFKLWTMSRSPLSLWAYLTRRRLLTVGIAFLVAAPLPTATLLLADIVSAISGGHNLIPVWASDAALAFLVTWMAVALGAFILFVFRPSRTTQAFE